MHMYICIYLGRLSIIAWTSFTRVFRELLEMIAPGISDPGVIKFFRCSAFKDSSLIYYIVSEINVFTKFR